MITKAHGALPRSSRHLHALCGRRKTKADYDAQQGKVDFGYGLCKLRTEPGTLVLRADADTEEHLERVRKDCLTVGAGVAGVAALGWVVERPLGSNAVSLAVATAEHGLWLLDPGVSGTCGGVLAARPGTPGHKSPAAGLT